MWQVQAVSYSYVQPRAASFPGFLPTFTDRAGDFDEWTTRRRRSGGEKSAHARPGRPEPRKNASGVFPVRGGGRAEGEWTRL